MLERLLRDAYKIGTGFYNTIQPIYLMYEIVYKLHYFNNSLLSCGIHSGGVELATDGCTRSSLTDAGWVQLSFGHSTPTCSYLTVVAEISCSCFICGSWPKPVSATRFASSLDIGSILLVENQMGPWFGF